MKDKQLARRKFLNKCLSAGSAILGSAFAFSSCNSNTSSKDEESDLKKNSQSPQSCDDLTGVSNEELEKRQSLGYISKTRIPDSYCAKCSLYIPGATENCGGCFLFKGPVHAEGYCVQYAPKAQG